MIARTLATAEYVAALVGQAIPFDATNCCGEEMHTADMRETSSVSITDCECFTCGRTTHIVQNHH